MSRIDRLELVVRNLADRILGEQITFDQIAEQEAAEQGVAYTPPAPQVQNTDPEVLSAIEEKLREIADSYAPTDTAPLHAEIANLRDRVSAADARHIEQERNVQLVIQAASELLARLEKAEGRLDQHKTVINDNGSVLSALQSAIESVGGEAEKKRAAA
jgi:chromosome segregation ATPase